MTVRPEASAYRLNGNGLSFVWTGDGKPDELTANYAKGAAVFVKWWSTVPRFGRLSSGRRRRLAPSRSIAPTGAGYLTNQVNPRLGMTTHFSFDLELLGKAMAEVRMHLKACSPWVLIIPWSTHQGCHLDP